MADEAIKRTRAGELKIRPQLCEDDWYRWLEGMQDWCISRQLWWGHRIPIYFVRIKDSTTDNVGLDLFFSLLADGWVFNTTVDGRQLLGHWHVGRRSSNESRTEVPWQRIHSRAGRRCAGHLVLLRSMAVFDYGLAR